jgi:hypothetical protein
MKFVLRRSRLPRHRAHWPIAARRRRSGPRPAHRHGDVAHRQTRSPFLLVLPLPLSRRIDVARDRGPTVDPTDQAFVPSGAAGIGIDAIVLRRTAPLESQSHGARTATHGAFLEFSFSSMGERKFGVRENSRGKPTVIPHRRWDKIRARGTIRSASSARRIGLNGSILEIWQFRSMYVPIRMLRGRRARTIRGYGQAASFGVRASTTCRSC